MDEPVWREADWQGGFRQLNPIVGDPAQVETRIAVAFDSEHLYVAFRCLNDPERPVYSRVTRRDGNMDQDNAVTLYLDTFHTRRDCYYFSTNSLGTQVDGRIGEDGGSNDKRWDCVWSVACREDSAGWTAEFAIPVKEIRFDEDSGGVWGVNFRRNYPELYEVAFWNYSDRRWQVSRFGDLVGLPRFRKSFNFSLYPYLVGLNANQPSTARKLFYSSGDTDLITGADLRFNIGAVATGNLTVNPDFATVEADQEEINLTRYETFFPEKRLYFLEDAELFQSDINVFYSRRIGDLDYGLKSSGRMGNSNFALLSARERASDEAPSSQTSVFRLQRDVLGSSNIGLLAVDRSFSGGANRVLSSDATINLPLHLRFTSQVVGSFPSEGKNTSASIFRLRRFTEVYNYFLLYHYIDPGFQENVNQVGFIPDENRRQVQGGANYTWWIRRRGIESVGFNANNNAFWSYKGTLRNLQLTQYAGVTLSNKIDFSVTTNYHTELFEERFHNNTIRPEIGFNRQQLNSVGMGMVLGRNFGSDLRQWGISTNLKPNDRLSLAYEVITVRLTPDPDRQNTVRHVLTAEYNFTPDLFLRCFSQYNSRNDRFYLYGLLGWRFRPPFGALYVACIADRHELWQDLQPYDREDLRTLFVKVTIPIER